MHDSFDETYDVVVIGGGPGGSTTAALVAEKGHRVLVVERAKFPRFHIGESLMPETYWVFERLGLLPKLRDSDFVRKYSVQFVTASGRDSAPFFFEDRKPHECSVTWQVERAEFDRMLLDHAAERGATVWQEANVTDVLLGPSDTDDLPRAHGVVVQRKGEANPRRIGARVVVDATGMNALLSRRLGIRQMDPALKKASIFSHYRGCKRDEGRNSGATLILSTKQNDGWFWYIPLRDDVTSVGVVADIDRLVKGRAGPPEEILNEEIANCPGLQERMKGAARCGPVHVCSDFSYRATRCAGDGWVLVGDAFGFLDPMYSSGVFLALKSGEMAADAINDGLERGNLSGAQLGRWGDELSHGMTVIRKLVYAFYTPTFSFGRFIKANPHHKDDVTAILVGEVFKPGADEIFEPMKAMAPIPDAIPLGKPGDGKRTGERGNGATGDEEARESRQTQYA
jgi:flavin-dependent dehydrogenase